MHEPASTPCNTGMENRRRNGSTLDDVTKGLIEAFFTRDDNSRITTGKKQTVIKNTIKEQKRLLLDSLTNLHEKFCSEHPDNNISYITFTRYRPFYVRQPTANDRDTCLCKKHENVQLAVDKLYQLGALKTKHAEHLLDQICCNTEKRECMWSLCQQTLKIQRQFFVERWQHRNMARMGHSFWNVREQEAQLLLG